MDPITFVREESPRLLARLTPDSPAVWGLMTPQHMVEHLSSLFYIARKDLGLPCVTPEERLERAKKFLWNDRPMKRDVPNPDLKAGELRPLRAANLEDAKALYLKSLAAFYAHYAAEPDFKTMHPVFGILGFREWEAFHAKHITHHFRQFGLLPLPVAE